MGKRTLIIQVALNLVEGEVMPYAAATHASVSDATASLIGATRLCLGRATEAERAVVEPVFGVWDSTRTEYGLLAQETLWSARSVSDAFGLIAEGEMALPDITLSGLAGAWAVVGADLGDPETVEHAAHAIAQAAQYRHDVAFGRRHGQEMESINAIVAAWGMLATGVLPPGMALVGHQADAVRAAWRIADHLLDVAQVASGERNNVEEAIATVTETGPTDGVVVVTKLGGVDDGKATTNRGVADSIRQLVGKRFARTPVPDVAVTRDALVTEFPWASAAIDVLLTDLVGERFRLRPTLLVGPPACGKSRLCRRLVELVGGSMARYDAASASDSSFGGTARRWNTAEPCFPMLAIAGSGRCDAVVMLDELDKCGTSDHNGRLSWSLLPMIEAETSARYPDPYIQAPIDLSHVSYLATANDELAVPAPLRDRMRLLRIPRPTAEHVPAVARAVVAEIEAERAWQVSPLTGDELEIAGRLWMQGQGSLRTLRAIIERVIGRREMAAARH